MKNILTLLLIMVIQIISAQKNKLSPCEQELETVRNGLTQLQKENSYYEQTLTLFKPIKSVEIDDLQIDIIKLTGSKKNMNLKIEFIYKNTAAENRTYFQCEQAFLIDPQGNQYQTYEVVVGAGNNIRVENIKPSVPMKATIQFKITDTTFPIIKELRLKFYSKYPVSNGSIQNAVFENLDVNWN